MTALGDYFPKRAKLWFSGAKYAADIGTDGVGKIKIPAMVAADTDGIVAAQAIVSAQDITTFAATYSDSVMGKFGRNVTTVGSAASTATVTVYGYDYLGQFMIETLTQNGTTAVAGKKAFARVTRIVTTTDADSNMDVGWGSVYGLPYKIIDIWSEIVKGVEASSAGTVVVGSVATQSATSAEPRGTYAPHSSNVADGILSTSMYWEIYGIFDITNLYGIAHYAG
jgi:hypothetical protein